MRNDLTRRLLVTVAVIAAYRVGCTIPLPTVRTEALQYIGVTRYSAIWQQFGGNPLSSVSFLALGIIPYVTATIVTGLLGGVIPGLGRLRETAQGQTRLRRINHLTAVGIAVLQAVVTVIVFARSRPMIGRTIEDGTTAAIVTGILLVMGFLAVSLAADVITRFGIGAGVSVLLLTTVLSALGAQIRHSLAFVDAGELAWAAGISLTATILAVAGLRSYQGLRAYAGELQILGRRRPVELRSHILTGGVAPMVFASSIIAVAAPLLQRIGDGNQELLAAGSVTHGLAFAFLVAVFARVNLRMTLDPVETANDFVNRGYFLERTPPGWATADRLSRLANTAAIAVAALLLPMIALSAFGRNLTAGLSAMLPASTVLLLGSVTVEVLREIERGRRRIEVPLVDAGDHVDDPWLPQPAGHTSAGAS